MLGIICGMASEARALGRWAEDGPVRIGISGARPERAESEAVRLIEAGCRLLMSWGVAGGLDPEARPGDLVIPSAVVDEGGGCWPFSPELGAAVAAAMPAPFRWAEHGQGRCILGLDRLVLSPNDKVALFALTGAVTADMETHRVAQVAASRRLPALAVRAVGDPLETRLPRLVAQALGEDGRPRLGRVALGLVQRPWELPSLMRVRRETDAALEALGRAAERAIQRAIEAVNAM
ncbi:MAG TPA: hypothetical protein VMM59_07740 [Thermohalobaculum sp.]|nr:hypothetical protein [Thermohalobaculum sp.]